MRCWGSVTQSLLRGDRDKPADSSYLEQCQQAKLPHSFWDAAALWEQEYLMWAGLPGVDRQQGSLLSHTSLPGCFPCIVQAGAMEQQEQTVAHRCGFRKCLVAAPGVQLSWATSCKTRGESRKWGEEGMLSTNKPKISNVCGKKFYKIVSGHLELSLQDCFHCLWLREVMCICYTLWVISLHAKFIPSCSKTGIRREFHTLPKAPIKSCIKNKSLPAAGIQ